MDSQLSACQDYCRKHRYAVVRQYIEEGHTGDSPYLGPESANCGALNLRPLFRLAILETVIFHPFDRIVCWTSDRWDRRTAQDSIAVLAALARNGVRVELVAPTWLEVELAHKGIGYVVAEETAELDGELAGERDGERDGAEGDGDQDNGGPA